MKIALEQHSLPKFDVCMWIEGSGTIDITEQNRIKKSPLKTNKQTEEFVRKAPLRLQWKS